MGEEDPGMMTRAPATELAPGRRKYSTDSRSKDIRELRDQIEASRQRIAQSLDTLNQEVEEGLDWRRKVRENPLKAIAFAAAVGFYLGVR